MLECNLVISDWVVLIVWVKGVLCLDGVLVVKLMFRVVCLLVGI